MQRTRLVSQRTYFRGITYLVDMEAMKGKSTRDWKMKRNIRIERKSWVYFKPYQCVLPVSEEKKMESA